MISSSRRWLRRNRTRFAVGAGVVGVTYIAGQYVVSKISEYREKAASDHAAKEKYALFRTCLHPQTVTRPTLLMINA